MNLEDAKKIQKIEEEIKDIFGFEDYSAYSDFEIEKEPEGNYCEDVFNVSFKLLEVELDLCVRFKEEEPDLSEDGAPTLELNVYEDDWREFCSCGWTTKEPVLYLLFEACGQLRNLKK